MGSWGRLSFPDSVDTLTSAENQSRAPEKGPLGPRVLVVGRSAGFEIEALFACPLDFAAIDGLEANQASVALAHSPVTLVRTIILARITSRLLGDPIFSNLALTMTNLATAAAAATVAMYVVAQLFPEANGNGTPMKLLGTATARYASRRHMGG
jgi:hypothetical protein